MATKKANVREYSKTKPTSSSASKATSGHLSTRSVVDVKVEHTRKPSHGLTLEEGDRLPSKEMLDQDGKSVNLSSFLGKLLVIYFYPKDDTPGCTKEACSFQANLGAFKKAKVAVVGVSSDSVEKHRKFADKYGLSFPLLVDENKAFAAACGVMGEKVLYGKRTMGVVRTTFVVDKTGVVRRIFRKVKVDGHTDEVLAVVKELG